MCPLRLNSNMVDPVIDKHKVIVFAVFITPPENNAVVCRTIEMLSYGCIIPRQQFIVVDNFICDYYFVFEKENALW